MALPWIQNCYNAACNKIPQDGVVFKLVDGKNHLDPIKTPLYSSSAYRGKKWDVYEGHCHVVYKGRRLETSQMSVGLTWLNMFYLCPYTHTHK